MVKDYSNSDRKPATPISFLSDKQGIFNIHHPSDKLIHKIASATTIVALNKLCFLKFISIKEIIPEMVLVNVVGFFAFDIPDL